MRTEAESEVPENSRHSLLRRIRKLPEEHTSEKNGVFGREFLC
jgi:hypothetical protein